MNVTETRRIEQTIAAVASQCLRRPSGVFDPTLPLGLQGIDSLATIELASALEDALGCRLPEGLLHDCENGRELAARIARLTSAGAIASETDPFTQMLADAVLPGDVRPVPAAVEPCCDLRAASHVLLTGATGFLGAALARELLEESSAVITCLVRPAVGACDARERLLRHLATAGIDVDAHAGRILVVEGDLLSPRIGLSRPAFMALAASIDAVCHAAAAVNWIYSYAALRAANVTGTVELLRLASVRAVPFHFVSSISTCYSTLGPRLAGEGYRALTGLRGIQLGYAQTKAVAEALVEDAADRGLPVRIYRPALISGESAGGAYNRDDLITALVLGCVHMGTAPDLDWKLDSVPVDFAARAIVGLSGAPKRVRHLVHPRPRHWRECVLWMRMYGYPLRLVPYHAWLRQLEAETSANGAGHPLRPLRTFFLTRHASAGGLTLPEIYEEHRRTHAVQDVSLPCPPLDASLLETYFAAFRAAGDLPAPSAPSSPSLWVRASCPDHLDLSPSFFSELLQRPVTHVEILGSGSDHSIVSELTAWRSGRTTGLFRVRARLEDGEPLDLRLKVKARDADVMAVGEALAGLLDADIGDEYARWSGRIGFDRSHTREVEVYRQVDPRFVRHAPRLMGSRRDDEAGTWILALEEIADATLMDPSATGPAWQPAEIAGALDGLASLHAIWFGREAELRRTDWIGYVPSTGGMSEMSGLWTALARHAAPVFSSWATPDVAAIQRRLIETLPAWWAHLECGPRTLIHHDFNPRNICLRPHLCAFDWELATIGAPQRDLAELLCFVLPPGAAAADAQRWVDGHRRRLERSTGAQIDAGEWQLGFHAALYDVMINRIATYAVVNRVRRQPFLPRIVRTWRQLYGHFPVEACL